MPRRWSLVLLVTLALASLPLSARQKEIGGGDPPPSPPPPPSSPYPDPWHSPGFTEEEPYRNSDMGPLGVVLSTGEFQITVTDMEIPGRGFPFTLNRTYRSKRDSTESFLGWNWHLRYDEYLETGGYEDSSGNQYPALRWTQGNGWRSLFVDWNLNGSYYSFGGFYGKLRYVASRGYQIRYPDGTVKTFGYQVQSPTGHARWPLTRIEDRNGSVMTFQIGGSATSIGHLNSITDTLGRRIDFFYDASDRIIRVTDFTGRSVEYGYDAAGNLVTVKAPEVRGTPNGNNFCDPPGSAECPAGRKTTTYAYNSACSSESALSHDLISIADARGQTFLQNTYFSSSGGACGPANGLYQDYVAGQSYGGGTVTYAYASLSTSDELGPNDPKFRATVTDRAGNVQVHDFNNQGNPIRIETQTNRAVRSLGGADEPNYVETYTYVTTVDSGGGYPMLVSRRTESGGLNVDGSGNLVSYAGGMTVEYHYDRGNADIFQQGNLLWEERTPGPRSAAQTALRTTTTYEPVFNQPATITDPRGHVTTLSYDYQEGSWSQLTAPGPGGTTPPDGVDPGWWDGATILSIQAYLAAHPVASDPNGDGYHRGGNPILASAGTAIDFEGDESEEMVTTYAYNGFGQPTARRDAELNETLIRYFAENDPDGDGIPTPTPVDGRTLSSVSGSGGGGYLKEKILDATPTLPPPNNQTTGRDSGQNPPAANALFDYTYDRVGNLKTTTDPRGIRTDTWINSLNQVIRITHAAASGDPLAPAFGYLEEFRYDANNNVIQHRSERRDDGSFTFSNRWITKDTTYDILDRKLTERITTDDANPISLTTTYAYDANGNLRKTIYPMGNAVLRLYDERDLLYREVVLGQVSPNPTDMTYDPATDSVTQRDYDGSGDVIQLTDPEGHAARSGYDGYNRKVVGFDPAWQKSTFSYDAGDHLLTQASFGTVNGTTPSAASGPPAPTYPELSRQNVYYDELGRGRRTDTKFFQHAGATQVLLATDSNAGLTHFPAGDPPTAVGDGWVTTLVRYDRLGRAVQAIDDNGHFSDTWYDGRGQKIKVMAPPASPFTFRANNPTDGRNAVDSTYDADGNLIATVETEYGADRSGNGAPRQLPPQPHRTELKYDSMNRMVETKLIGRIGAPAVNLTTSIVYDSRGNKVQVTDPAGGRTKSTFDGMNRLLKTEAGYFWSGSAESVLANLINPANPDGLLTTRYAYDDDGRLTSVADDNNRTTTYGYDHLGRRTRVTYPDGTYQQITFDRDSLATLWERRDTGTSRLAVMTAYDVLHRAIQKDVDNAQAPGFLGTKRQSFEYDGAGRMTRAVDDQNPADGFLDSEVTLAYNSLGKPISESQTYRDSAGVMGTNTVTSTYNGVRFRTSVTYPGGRVVTFSPDEMNRLESLADSYTGTTKYDYLGPSRVLNRIYPNHTKLTLLSSSTDDIGAGYDNARRVVDFANKTIGGSPVAQSEFAYGYDNAGNRLFERRVHEPAGANWKGEAYSYDAVYRMTGWSEGNLNASGALQGAASATRGFTLDGMGNWTGHARNGSSFTNSVNSLNQYTGFQDGSGTRALSYDFTGNLTSETLPGPSTLRYAYDFASRLARYTATNGAVTTYRYDALGRRISKSLNGESPYVRFVYDGDRLIEERGGGGALVASYVYGNGVDEVLTRRRTSGGVTADLFYQTNALGSVAVVTDSDGAVIERYKYDAYGAPTFMTPGFGSLTGSTVMNNLLFTGRYLDVESGLYHYRARGYHPTLGRFLQRDPAGESASLNLYAYVFNNPVNATDPTGMYASDYFSVRSPREGGHSFSRREMGGGGYSLQQRMQYRGGSYEDYRGAQFRDFEEGQAANDRDAESDREDQERSDKRARVAAYRQEALRKELKASLQDPQNMKNMEDPKGVVVNVLGSGQNAGREVSGEENKSELDESGKDVSLAGKVVLNVSAKNLMVPGEFGEVSEVAVAIVADTVQSVTDKACGNLQVEINGFSRGGGPAVGLTNMLTGTQYGLSGSNSTLNLIDPYMSRNWNHVYNRDVHINDFRGTQSDPVSVFVNWGAHLLGIGNRYVYMGAFSSDPLKAISLQVSHTQMDTFVPGALGTKEFLGY